MKKKLLYQEIYESLKTRVLSSSHRLHHIPSERVLAQEYGVSRVTIRQALQMLVKDGIIKKTTRAVSAVQKQVFHHDVLSVESLKEEFERAQVEYSIRILTFEKIAVNQEIANFLHIKEKDEAFFIERLIIVEGTPTIYERCYMPCYLFPELAEENVIVKYDYIEKEKNMIIRSVHRKLMAAVPSKKVKEHLMLKNDVVLYISMNTELSNGHICEYVEQYFHQDHYFTISASRH